MNEKDKEQYNFWLGKLSIAYRPNAFDAWQAACEYKDKSIRDGSKMKQMNEDIERLKAENAYKQKEIDELKLEIMQIKGQRNQAEFKLVKAIEALKQLEE